MVSWLLPSYHRYGKVPIMGKVREPIFQIKIEMHGINVKPMFAMIWNVVNIVRIDRQGNANQDQKGKPVSEVSFKERREVFKSSEYISLLFHCSDVLNAYPWNMEDCGV